jgi:hypothetical protein
VAFHFLHLFRKNIFVVNRKDQRTSKGELGTGLNTEGDTEEGRMAERGAWGGAGAPVTGLLEV